MFTYEPKSLELWFDQHGIKLGSPFYQNGNRGPLVSRCVGMMDGKQVFIQIPKPQMKQQFIEEYEMRQFLREQDVSTPAVLLLEPESGTVVEEYKGPLNLCDSIVVEEDYDGPMTLYILLKQDVTNHEVAIPFLELAQEQLAICRQALTKYFSQTDIVSRHHLALFESFYKASVDSLEDEKRQYLHSSIAHLRQTTDFEIIKGDSGAGNFLLEWETNKLYLIDFEEAGLGFKWQDEVRLLFTSGLCLPQKTVFTLAESWGLLDSHTALSQMCILCTLRRMQAIQAGHMDRAGEYSNIFQKLTEIISA